MKRCTKCQATKELGDFYHLKNGRPYSWCRQCVIDSTTQWRLRNPEKAVRNQRRSKLGKKLQEFGVTLSEYESRVRDQNGLCAICEQAEATWYRLCLDHDHATGQFRGLLCHNCNSILGLAQDNVEVLRRAIEYLEASACAAR